MKHASQMPTLATFFVAALSIAASISGAAASTVTINSNASGFYQSTGGTPSPGSTNILEDSTRNNYFAFDLSGLSGLSGPVTAAKLTIFGPNGLFLFNSTTPSTVTYSIYDVTTNIGALIGHTGGVAAFTDLGSGLVYGSTSFAATTGATPQLVIDLSGGLNDINAALGGLFALGGGSSLVDNQGFLWSSSSLNPAAQLTLESTPLPAALPLFATVFGGSGLVAWRRRRKLSRATRLFISKSSKSKSWRAEAARGGACTCGWGSEPTSDIGNRP